MQLHLAEPKALSWTAPPLIEPLHAPGAVPQWRAVVTTQTVATPADALLAYVLYLPLLSSQLQLL